MLSAGLDDDDDRRDDDDDIMKIKTIWKRFIRK